LSTKHRKENPVGNLSDPGKKALLHLCYQAVRETAPKYGCYDSILQADLAEALVSKIEDFIKLDPSKREIVEFRCNDADTYDYLCAILGKLQETLPFMNHFNVILHIERIVVVKKEDMNAAATSDSGGEGGSTDLADF
jgi:hypothetical protein